jgi:hypothetical protein
VQSWTNSKGVKKKCLKNFEDVPKKLGDYKGIKKILKICGKTSRQLWGILVAPNIKQLNSIRVEIFSCCLPPYYPP